MTHLIRLDSHRDQAGAWEICEQASGELAFDVGANIGVVSRLLAKNFTRVIALEPCFESFEVLETESPSNVVCLRCAASSYTGQVRLTESADSIKTGQLTTGSGLSWGSPIGTRMVPCVTLDDLIAEYGMPDFVKIDVEGHEVDVLDGWSTTPRPKTLVEVHRAENEFKVRELFGGDMRKLEHDPATVGAWTRSQHFWLTNA